MSGGGRADRRAKGTQGVLRELQRNGFPVGYRVLCCNCNMALGAYKFCPHLRQASALGERTASLFEQPSANGTRRCTLCRRELPTCAFYPSKLGRDGLQSRCRVCTRKASVERLQSIRREVLAVYGSGDVACKCCGEREEQFLALDHINGAGPRQPGRRGGGNSFYSWLKKQGFPPGLQVLCHNCNCAKRNERECPHAKSNVNR